MLFLDWASVHQLGGASGAALLLLELSAPLAVGFTPLRFLPAGLDFFALLRDFAEPVPPRTNGSALPMLNPLNDAARPDNPSVLLCPGAALGILSGGTAGVVRVPVKVVEEKGVEAVVPAAPAG